MAEGFHGTVHFTAQLMRRLFVTIMVALGALSPAVPGYGYEITNRWTSTSAGFTGSQGSAIALTWSLAANGTQINQVNFGGGSVAQAGPSDLITYLDGKFGAGSGGSDYTQRPWFSHFQSSFDRLSELAGITYTYQPNDDGVTIGTSSGNSARGDVRIAGNDFGSSAGSTLAYNAFPNNGDMVLNTDASFGNSANNYRGFRNTIMHEAMHGLGIGHVESTASGFLIEPLLSTSFDGPQLDDILALQRNYGDVYEKGGGNNTAATATSLGTLVTNQTLAIGQNGNSTTVGANDSDFVSIDDNSDADYFSFTVTESTNVSLQLDPQGTTYQVGPQNGSQSTLNSRALSNLTLHLYGTNGSTLLEIGSSGAIGESESIVRQLSPGTYYTRVNGAQDDVQLYQLSVSTFRDPANLLWRGQVSALLDVGTSANFTEGAVTTTFRNGDTVRFSNVATRRDITLDQSVDMEAAIFDASLDYTISGSGSITGGSLTLDGSGTVTLATSGNSYAGPTQINAGTLKLTGNLSAMQSDITIASGGTLVMNASDSGTMSSLITVNSGGELHIGDPLGGIDTNVFPNDPTGVVNNGLIRIFNLEAIGQISGAGDLIVETGTGILRSGSTFTGQVIVRDGAIADIESNQGLGSAVSGTTIEAGGRLLVGQSLTISDPLLISGDGRGHGAVEVDTTGTVNFLGSVTTQNSPSTVVVNANAIANFQAGMTAAAAAAGLTIDSAGTTNISGLLYVGNGGLRKQGTGTLNATNVVTALGAIRVEAGQLRFSGSGNLNSLVEVDAGATLTLDGTHVWQASSTLAGAGTVSQSVNTPGKIAPGDADVADSIATLTLTDHLMLQDTSLLQFEIGGDNTGQFDRLVVGRTATLDGDLSVELINAYLPQAGDQFELLTTSLGLLGSLDGTSLPSLGGGLDWDLIQGANSLTLSVIATLGADFNGDGDISHLDLAVWQNGYGSTNATVANGDANGDAAVNGRDLLAWQTQYGSSAAQAALAAVPEPSTAILAAMALLLTPCRKRSE